MNERWRLYANVRFMAERPSQLQQQQQQQTGEMKSSRSLIAYPCESYKIGAHEMRNEILVA